MAKKAIIVDQFKIPPEGVQAVVRFGEYFDDIEWGEPETVTIKVCEKVNMEGEPGLLIGDGWGFAGLQKGKNIYWRYMQDAVYGTGEHCVKIVELL